jgi:hypothetical protein
VSRKKKELSVYDFAHKSGEYLRFCRLPIVNGFAVRSISTDDERKSWKYSCYNDSDGAKARSLEAKGLLPPKEIFRLFGTVNLNNSLHFVRSITFNIWATDLSKVNPLVTVKTRRSTFGLYSQTHNSGMLGILDCDYGRKLAALLGKRMTTMEDHNYRNETPKTPDKGGISMDNDNNK